MCKMERERKREREREREREIKRGQRTPDNEMNEAIHEPHF